jgi:hypothetical protein
MPAVTWASVGNAPTTGLSVPTRPTRANKRRDRLLPLATNQPDRALGFEDDVWGRRAAQPQRHAWSDAQPVRLVDKTVPAKAPEGKAVACDGLDVPTANPRLWRFVLGRPVSAVTCTFRAWLAGYFTAPGKRALWLLWDKASWHVSQAVQAWIKAHTHQAKPAGGWRVIRGTRSGALHGGPHTEGLCLLSV